MTTAVLLLNRWIRPKRSCADLVNSTSYRPEQANPHTFGLPPAAIKAHRVAHRLGEGIIESVVLQSAWAPSDDGDQVVVAGQFVVLPPRQRHLGTPFSRSGGSRSRARSARSVGAQNLVRLSL